MKKLIELTSELLEYDVEPARAARCESVTAILAVAALAVFICVVSGCSIEPERVSAFAEHMSHATQHPPFTDHNQTCGADIVGVAANWDISRRVHLSVSEGIALERHYPAAPGYQDGSYGEIIGPNREQFEARVSFDLWSKK